MDRNSRIGILLSGRPGQRELSLRQGEAIMSALTARGHTAVPVFLDAEADLLVRQSEIGSAFLAVQGRYGADGCLQGFLEMLGIPYTGSGVLASSLAANLVKTKEVLRFHNLPTAAGYVFDLNEGQTLRERHGAFGFPVSVRPVVDGSSMQHSTAYDELDLETYVEDALRLGDQVLIERDAPGRKVWVGVLDGVPLGVLSQTRERPRTGSPLSTPVKMSSAACNLPAERLRSVLRLAALACEALGCEGAATVAVQVSERGNEMVREVDASPYLTPASPMGRIARMAGIEFPELIVRVLQGARLRAHGRRDSQRHVQVAFDGPDRRRDSAPHAH